MIELWRGLAGLLACTALVLACSSSSDGADDDSDADDDDSSASGGTAQVSTADCKSRCAARTRECDVPSAQAETACANLCGGSLSKGALECIEDLPCAAGEDEVQDCVDEHPPGSSSSGGATSSSGGSQDGKEGDACTCAAGSGEWECSGTGICSDGLVCQGSGSDPGTCVEVCCTSKDECAPKIGQEGGCGSGQVCSCRAGYECVGDECTCPGGTEASRGYCQSASR